MSEATQDPGRSTAMPVLLPWLADDLAALLDEDSPMHHALLLHGAPGIGKYGFALQVAAAFLCEAPKARRACGACVSCGWMTTLSHPDMRMIRPEALDPDFVPASGRKPSREIRIEQIRALASFMAVGAHRDGWRIILIEPADAMNHVTANSLLKTLEEPGPRTLLMLVTSHPDRLPATIRSRCRARLIPAPTARQAREWLLASGATDADTADRALRAAGSPLHAAQLADPANMAAHQAILEAIAALPDTGTVRAADALDGHDAHAWATVLQRWVSDLTRVVCGTAPHYFPDRFERMGQIVAHSDLGRLTALQRRLSSLAARIEHPLNARLLCESTILAYCEAFDSGRRAR